MVSRVMSPAGTITQTTRGAGSCWTMSSRVGDVADVLVGVVADDGVPGPAQPLAHVATHPTQADESDLHAGASAVVSPVPVRTCPEPDR